MKIQSKETLRKECGIRPRKILCGKRIRKINTPKRRKERKLTRNGKRKTTSPFLKLVKWRIRTKLLEPRRTGAIEERVATDGRRPSQKVKGGVETLRTTKLRRLKKSSRSGL
jgi:hypothetical protein